MFGANLISALNTNIHPRKEAIIVEGSLILVLSVSRLNIDLDQLENGATPQFTPMATSKVFFFLPLSYDYVFSSLLRYCLLKIVLIPIADKIRDEFDIC